MNAPSEHHYIEKCKQLIEARLVWAQSSEWKNRDYEYLSELIFAKTKVSISVSTLKRIWLNDTLRVPHLSTLNSLAQYLDYNNWNDFKTKLKFEIIVPDGHSPAVVQKKKKGFASIALGISALVIISILLFSLKSFIGKPNAVDSTRIVFTSKKTVSSGLPNTVLFNYDISKIDFDSAFIQQDWDKSKRQKILKENNYHNCIYYYPGYYTAKLVINNEVVKKFPLSITTDGWIAVYKKQFTQEIPVYLKNINPVKKDRLHVSVEDLKANKIENDKDFFVGFYNARDFGEVYCDSFAFETEVKNDPKDGGLTCQFVAITVEGEEGLMTSSFSEKGCTSKLFLRFGNVYVDGVKNNLSAFGTNLNDWRKIKYEVVNKVAGIFVDNQKIYEFKFDNNIGKIIGISYHFYGCGSVRMAKLFDRNNKLVYEEKFR